MNATFQIFKTLLGACLAMLLMGLFSRSLRFHRLPDPDEPGLSGPQQMAIGSAQQASRQYPFLIRVGLAGTGVCLLAMVLITILR